MEMPDEAEMVQITGDTLCPTERGEGNFEPHDAVYGGYILLSRRMLESDIMARPPLHLKLWVWFLLKAAFRDTPTLKRGQLTTSIEEMREAMAYHVGYRKQKPSEMQIRRSYEGFTKDGMINTKKIARGLKITILNYERYQDPKNYEGHNEEHHERYANVIYPTDKLSKPASVAARSVPKNDKNVRINILPIFEIFWEAYPRKVGKAKALQAWKKLNGNHPPIEQLLQSLDAQKKSPQWQRDSGQFIPYPATWLNQARWADEMTAPNESEGWEFD